VDYSSPGAHAKLAMHRNYLKDTEELVHISVRYWEPSDGIINNASTYFQSPGLSSVMFIILSACICVKLISMLMLFIPTAQNYWGDGTGPEFCCNPKGRGSRITPDTVLHTAVTYWCTTEDCTVVSPQKLEPLCLTTGRCPAPFYVPSWIKSSLLLITVVLDIVADVWVILQFNKIRRSKASVSQSPQEEFDLARTTAMDVIGQAHNAEEHKQLLAFCSKFSVVRY